MKVLIGFNMMGLEKAIPDLQRQFPAVQFEYCAQREETTAMIGDADVYMGWLDRSIFVAARRLQWIQSPSSGVNYFLDIPELLTSDVLLTSASGTHGVGVAESALAMILAFTRGIRAAIQVQPQHKWALREIRPHMVELTGMTMGIIGLGAIGKALAKRADAFDMRILAVDLYPTNKPETVDELWGLERLDDLLAQSDFVVVTVPYTAQTDGMVSAAQIAKMKPTALLVGMSRGGIIDQDAMMEALATKRIAGAALDVLKPEPLPADHPLWDMENVLVAPHIAGGTQYEMQYVLEIFRENLDRFLAGRLPLRNQVDKQRGF